MNQSGENELPRLARCFLISLLSANSTIAYILGLTMNQYILLIGLKWHNPGFKTPFSFPDSVNNTNHNNNFVFEGVLSYT